MNSYQIGQWTSKTTKVVASEFGTFHTIEDAKDYILFELLADYADFMDGKSMWFITPAVEVAA
jgi:hypothetical protein